MEEPTSSPRAFRHPLRDDPVPAAVAALADGADIEPIWRNQLGGLTYRIGDRVVKWNPRRTGVDLDRELERLRWLHGRHPVPVVLAAGADDEAQWLVTEALPGESVVVDAWQDRRTEAIRAIADGLRALHALPTDEVPAGWATASWPNRTPASLGPRPPLDDAVLVHGDACAPNTIIGVDGRWVGHVDLGDLTVADRWADVAVASMSVDWNFGEGHQQELFDAYGVEPDPERIRWYRALWRLES